MRLGKVLLKPVTTIFKKLRPIYDFIVEDVNGNKSLIKTTDDHPFFIVKKGWVKTIVLQYLDIVSTSSINNANVISVERTNETDNTYNIEVVDFHTYFVTNLELLVHNCELTYDDSSYNRHGDVTKSSAKGEVSPAPADGQAALNNSHQVNSTSTKRIGVDVKSKQVVRLMENGKGSNKYHGHVVKKLTEQEDRNLVKKKFADRVKVKKDGTCSVTAEPGCGEF